MNLNNPFNTVNVNQEIIYGVQLYDTAEGHKGSTCPETLPEGELSTQVAKTYEEQRNPSKGDLLIYRYNTANSKGQSVIHSKITRVEGGTVYAEAICFIQGEGSTGGTKLDDIKEIRTFHSLAQENTVTVDEAYGIQWDGEYTLYKDLTQDERATEGKTHHTIPVIPGDGIEFEVNEKGNTVKIKATGGSGGAGGGISDVQVNGTSVVTDGVANIPEASDTQAGVVTTGAQTLAGVKTFYSGIKVGSGNGYYSGLIKMPTANNYSNFLQIQNDLMVGGGDLGNSVPRTQIYGGRILIITSSKSTAPLIDVKRGANGTTRSILLPDRAGEFMVAPSTWSTGTSGTATLPSAGLYEIKTLVQHPNPEATYGFVIHSVIYWDGTNEASGELIRTPTISASTCKEFYVSETGVIYFGETDLDGFGGGTISTQISYRKIGIA